MRLDASTRALDPRPRDASGPSFGRRPDQGATEGAAEESWFRPRSMRGRQSGRRRIDRLSSRGTGRRRRRRTSCRPPNPDFPGRLDGLMRQAEDMRDAVALRVHRDDLSGSAPRPLVRSVDEQPLFASTRPPPSPDHLHCCTILNPKRATAMPTSSMHYRAFSGRFSKMSGWRVAFRGRAGCPVGCP